MHFVPIGSWQILNDDGRRKYVTAVERRAFLAAADRVSGPLRAFAYVLTFTGCRVSEALSLAPHQIDAEQCRLIFRTLKRRHLVYRAVPAPDKVIAMVAALSAPEGDRVAELAAFIAEHGAIGAALLDYYSGDIDEAREAIADRYLGAHTSLADYVQEATEEGTAIPTTLRYYIDWQAMARDAEVNGDLFSLTTAWDVVHVFAGC